MPKISVIMPAYNAEKYIAEAIESILSQTFTDFEFIIINDSSTDATEDIIKSFNDKRIIYLKNEKNLQISDSLNRGIAIATGKYIARMDADDISLPSRLQKQVNYMDEHDDIFLLGTAIKTFGEGMPTQLRKFSTKHKMLISDMLFSSAIAHPSVMLRRSLFSEEGFFYNPEFNGMEDYVLFWQIAFKHNIATLPDVLLKYRIHKSQITQNPLKKSEKLMLKFKETQLEDLKISATNEEINSFYYSSCIPKPILCKTSFDAIKSIYSKIMNAFNSPYSTEILTARLITLGKHFMLSTREICANFGCRLDNMVIIKAAIKDFFKFFSKKLNLILTFLKTHPERKQLKVKNFTIISNNCWGGFIYQKYGLPYLTPTAGLLIFGDDYVKFCANLKLYTQQNLEFIPFEKASHYEEIKDTQGPYPVARLGDIEIYFMHYATNEEAAEKWYRRCKRINWNNIIYKISHRDLFTEKDITDFINLKLNNSLCFAPFDSKDTVYIPNIDTLAGDETPVIAQHFDFTEYINNLKR